jgi:hypothetical protein
MTVFAERVTGKLCRPSKVKVYAGIRAPRCNKGLGCVRCWTKYYSVEAAKKRLAYRVPRLYRRTV